MTRCASRGEFGRARHRDEQLQCCVWRMARRSRFSQAFAAQTQFEGCSKVEAHCLALEGSPFDRTYT